MKPLALLVASITVSTLLSQVKHERERRACLLVSNNPKVLKCQSTQFGGAMEWARTAQVGDKWQPVGDDPITVTLEADSIQSDTNTPLQLPAKALGGSVKVTITNWLGDDGYVLRLSGVELTI